MNIEKIKLVLMSHGLKKLKAPLPDQRVIPKADFYIDCRGITDGASEAKVQAAHASTLTHMLDLILYSLAYIESRRAGVADPYKEPYVVCFLCAHGMNRSVAVKNILSRKLLALGFDVKIR